MSKIRFLVSIPVDEEFIGRECNIKKCKKYFRVHTESIRSHMHCPYCGNKFSNDELHTSKQIRYFRKSAEEKAKEYMCGEIDKIFSKFARNLHSNKFFSLEHKPIQYRAKSVVLMYHEKKVDSELICPQCTFRFQIYGIFGFCPGCRSENILIYDANISVIRKEIEESTNPRRALRHAYSDLVSTFQLFCSRKASHFPNDKPSFQEIFPSREFFKQAAGIDILASLMDSDLLTIRRIFQKRHVWQHADGKITKQYVKKVPEDAAHVGKEAELSIEEFEKGARLLRRVIDNIIKSIDL